MYRILIADDEGLMLESLKTIILGQYADSCEVEVAKTGRAVIEKSEEFHPDIVFMDIQMPGINGIQAIPEIRKSNSTALFYIISAYDKFDYAKEAIDLGVEKYLTKPISKKTFLSVVEEAMQKVDRSREQRSTQLEIQEKLETVTPVVEQSIISNLLVQTDMQDISYYLQLLGIEEEYGYIMTVQFGEDYEDGRLVSPLRVSVQARDFYPEFHDLAHAVSNCVVGPVMSNSIVLLVPCEKEQLSYEDRISTVETARTMAASFEEHLDARFRIGIGRVCKMESLQISYREAVRALENDRSQVIHIDDLQQSGRCEEEFPVEAERRMFRAAEAGDTPSMLSEANAIFDWMVDHYPQERSNICLKVLEYIIRSERIAFESGTVNYNFSDRRDYLDTAESFRDYESLRQWFLDRMAAACDTIRDYQESRSNSVVKKAQAYIQENFSHDISLDDVSRAVNVSPYYFSKLFKDEAGETFIDYLTRVRIEKAKELLEGAGGQSIKEISAQCGYADPNYFSRLFKKQTDMTPREYRMREQK